MKELKTKVKLDMELCVSLQALDEERYAARSDSEDEEAIAQQGNVQGDKRGWITYSCPCKEALKEFDGAVDCKDCAHKLFSWRSPEACAKKAWMHLLRKEAHAELKAQMEEGSDDISVAFVKNLKIVEFEANGSDRAWFWWQCEKRRKTNQKKRKRAARSSGEGGEVQLFCAKTEFVEFL